MVDKLPTDEAKFFHNLEEWIRSYEQDDEDRCIAIDRKALKAWAKQAGKKPWEKETVCGDTLKILVNGKWVVVSQE